MATEADRPTDAAGLAWQIGVWDQMSDLYGLEIDARFLPVTEQVLTRAALQPGEQVLDLGTGTGAVAVRAAARVLPGGIILAIDPSREMLQRAQRRAAHLGQTNITFREGRGEAIPAQDASLDAVLASLSLMYAINRPQVARELGRVLRPGGRLVAAVWGGPEACDIVRFQATAGRFAPMPPVPGVGPGALADPTPFLAELATVAIDTAVATELLSFEFPDFASAWDVLAGVTTANLAAERQAEAKAAVRAAMWPDPERPRQFRNLTQFILGQRRA